MRSLGEKDVKESICIEEHSLRQEDNNSLWDSQVCNLLLSQSQYSSNKVNNGDKYLHKCMEVHAFILGLVEQHLDPVIGL